MTVVGASVDPVTRLQKFRDKYDLAFHFVSDLDRAIGLGYGTLKGDATTTHERDTVVISFDGIIKLAYKRVSASGHATKVLADVTRLHGEGGL